MRAESISVYGLRFIGVSARVSYIVLHPNITLIL